MVEGSVERHPWSWWGARVQFRKTASLRRWFATVNPIKLLSPIPVLPFIADRITLAEICVIKRCTISICQFNRHQANSHLSSLHRHCRLVSKMCFLLLSLLSAKRKKDKATEQMQMAPHTAPQPVQLSSPYVQPPRRLGISRRGRRYQDDLRNYGYEAEERNRRRRDGIAAAA